MRKKKYVIVYDNTNKRFDYVRSWSYEGTMFFADQDEAILFCIQLNFTDILIHRK